jgi:hypothetical protein
VAFPKTLTVTAWAPEIEGCGAELEIKWQVIQTTKQGRQHRTRLALKVDRYVVRQLMEQVAQMQDRDRERLSRETNRLGTELAPVVAPRSSGNG